MIRWNVHTPIVLLLAMFAMSSAVFAVATPVKATQLESTEFVQLSQDLERMRELLLLKGGKKEKKPGKEKPVEFDEKGARKEGFPENSIALAREITQFSNEVLDQLKSVNDSVEDAVLDVQRYPRLAAFYQAAST